jgi:hypothetical protein
LKWEIGRGKYSALYKGRNNKKLKIRSHVNRERCRSMKFAFPQHLALKKYELKKEDDRAQSFTVFTLNRFYELMSQIA